MSPGRPRRPSSGRRTATTRLGRWFAALSVAAAFTAAFAAPPSAGDAAPDYVADDLDGRPISLDTYRGKVVVITFWASWCPPCRKELPILEGMQEQAGRQHLQVIAVNTESIDTYRKLAKGLKQFEIAVAFDAGKRSSTAYGVHGIPHMIVIDRHGRIVRVNRGYAESELDRIIDDVNHALLAVD